MLDSVAVKVTIYTVQGEKFKLMLMTGDGAFGALGGGEGQRAGAAALGRWLSTLN